jgi:hypothetical protein
MPDIENATEQSFVNIIVSDDSGQTENSFFPKNANIGGVPTHTSIGRVRAGYSAPGFARKYSPY